MPPPPPSLPLLSPLHLSSPPPSLSPSHLSLPTSILYAAPSSSSSPAKHYGPYKTEREALDWNYHKIPTRERQELQDEIVGMTLERRNDCGKGTEEGGVGEGDGGRRAVFTAGGMGAGKGHTLRELLKQGVIRLPKDFVWVDPDILARQLPEREAYIRHSPLLTSSHLHPEASLLQEVVENVARKQGRSLVVDGSLTDCEWAGGIMKNWTKEGWKCEILFVYAEEEVMLRRAERRAKITGRVTDPEAIKRSRIKSPECVARLSTPSHVTRVRLINNASDDLPAVFVYDSDLDPTWIGGGGEGGKGEVDVKGFVDGLLRQGEDGRVVRCRAVL